MKRLVVLVAVVAIGWRAAEGCGPWFVVRPALYAMLWQPSAKSIPELLGPPRPTERGVVFAGMHAGGTPTLAAARQAYRELARWRSAHFQPWDPDDPPFLEDYVATARKSVEEALTREPAVAESEELQLLRAKISLRHGEALLLKSKTKFVTPESAPQDAFRRAQQELNDFLKQAHTPSLSSEARGWLARCHYLLGEPHAAARIYLDELDHPDSALETDVLWTSLRLLFPYNGSDAALADHLNEYFDTPRHALFAIDLATNPVYEGQRDAAIGRKAVAALERHQSVLADSQDLVLAGMRASLYMGDPAAALRIAGSAPPRSAEGRWMSAVAHFLMRQYDQAEPDLLAVADDKAAPKKARALALLGLLGVYQQLGRGTDQLRAAFRYEEVRGGDWDWPGDGYPWNVGWPYAGWLMDLSYLLDVQLTDDGLQPVRDRLEGRSRDALDYELAVRAARREDYATAAAIYSRLGARRRADRMRRLAALFEKSRDAAGRYAYAAYLADHTERVFFNDRLWRGFQTSAFLDRRPRPELMSPEQYAALVRNERAFRDAQEERWRAFLILEQIAREHPRMELGRRAASKALQCLGRINTDRFGRTEEIAAARQRLLRGNGPLPGRPNPTAEQRPARPGVGDGRKSWTPLGITPRRPWHGAW
ncbi:MAG TPA: hypothetical protein VGN09_24490 [Vicinamibacteria bacterium]